jgi:hypothetical protein
VTTPGNGNVNYESVYSASHLVHLFDEIYLAADQLLLANGATGLSRSST